MHGIVVVFSAHYYCVVLILLCLQKRCDALYNQHPHALLLLLILLLPRILHHSRNLTLRRALEEDDEPVNETKRKRGEENCELGWRGKRIVCRITNQRSSPLEGGMPCRIGGDGYDNLRRHFVSIKYII